MKNITTDFAETVGPTTMEVFFCNFPAIVEVPYDGIWNIVIDTHSHGDTESSVSITILPNHELLEQQDVIK